MNGGGATADVVLGLGLGFDPEYGEEWDGEREREQVGFVVVFFHQGAGSTRGASGGMAAQCSHSATGTATGRYYR